MARVGKKGILSGLVGNLVFRNLEGKQVVQSSAEGIRQSEATKNSASEFRQCSRWTKHLRMALKLFLMGHTDSFMYRRFNGAFYNALQQNTSMLKGQRTPLNAALSQLAGFDFNSHSPFKDSFLPEILTSLENQNSIKVIVPALEPKTQILFPQKTYSCELLVYVTATNFDYNTPVVDAFFTLPLELSQPFHDEFVWVSPTLPQGHFAMVTAKLLFYSSSKFTEKHYINNKEFNPSMIVSSFIIP